MLWTPRAPRITTIGQTLASSSGTAATAHASNNTKGNYAEISSSIPHGSTGIVIHGALATAGDMLMDLAIGGAGSEVDIFPNLLVSAISAVSFSVFVPLALPAGQRLSVRCQHTTGGTAMSVEVTLIGGGGSAMQRVETCGATTADSGGIAVDPGGSINTKGAYSQLIATTAFAYKHVILALGGRNNSANGSANWLVDIAVGAAASEVVIVGDLRLRSDAAHDLVMPPYFSFPCDIPAGSRIAVRAQSSNADATDRLIDAVLYGVG